MLASHAFETQLENENIGAVAVTSSFHVPRRAERWRREDTEVYGIFSKGGQGVHAVLGTVRDRRKRSSGKVEIDDGDDTDVDGHQKFR